MQFGEMKSQAFRPRRSCPSENNLPPLFKLPHPSVGHVNFVKDYQIKIAGIA